VRHTADDSMRSPISRLRSSGRTSPLVLNILFPHGSHTPLEESPFPAPEFSLVAVSTSLPESHQSPIRIKAWRDAGSPLAIHWPQKTIGTQARPNEWITDSVVAGWLQPLGGSRLGQLRVPHSFGEDEQGQAAVQSGRVVVPTPIRAQPPVPSL